MLISHIPNPRILKRIKSLEDNFEISLVYWDRGQAEKESFEINHRHKVMKVSLDAPQGVPFKRIIPLCRYIVKAISILKREDPEIIHAANMDMLFIATRYRRIFNKDVKIVYEVADLPKYSFVKKIDSLKSLIAKTLQRAEKNMSKNISEIILTSPYFWDVYFSKFISKDKYLFMPNAPSKELFDKYQPKVCGSFTIGFIGSVRYVEQLKMLIDAVQEIEEDIQVLIAGSGPGYGQISEYSKDKHFVEMYGPYNYEKEIVSLYEKVDCTYSVYNAELENVKIALPNRLYESIICEMPIIGAKGTVLGQFIEEEQIGLTVDYNDKEGLKKQLSAVIKSKEKVILYQKNCRQIKRKYYYENNSAILLKEYLNL